MDFDVVTVSVTEHQLFNIPQISECLEKSPEVKRAGVFKVVLEESIRGQGSSLEQLTNVDKGRFLDVAKKQYVIGFPNCRNIYGHRTVDMEFKDAYSEDLKDGDEFLRTVTNAASYDISTCCSTVLKEGGEEGLVIHFFSDVLPTIVVEGAIIGYTPKPIALVLKQGKKDADSLKKFSARMSSLPLDERERLINDIVMKDSRLEEENCNCPCCCIDDITVTGDNAKKGVMSGCGVEVLASDRIKMTKHFGLYSLACTSLLRLLDFPYPGVTNPFLHYGSTHSFFPAHIEDVSLYSWNYLHYGHSKIWVVIPPRAIRRLHNCLATSSSNINHTTCQNLLGHKYFLITPSWLKDQGIPFKVVIQRAGESIILCPNAVHFGFNSGYNIAESCNFATESWIPYGIVAPRCRCLGGEFHMNIERVIAAKRPDLVDVYRRQAIPNITSEQDPYFYSSILKTDEPLNSESLPQRLINAQLEEQDAVSQQYVEQDGGEPEQHFSDDVFPELPTKQRGRKLLACPKVTCGKQYKYGKRKNLFDHVQKFHKDDADFDNLKAALDQLFPLRDKTKRRTCALCGKKIAGRATQMKYHQQSAACRPNEPSK